MNSKDYRQSVQDAYARISEEALRRLRVEAAFGRGEDVEYRARQRLASWGNATTPTWDWENYDYRVKRILPPQRTKAEIMDQLHALLHELRRADGPA